MPAAYELMRSITALEAAVRAWGNPDYPARVAAMEKAAAADERIADTALLFSFNALFYRLRQEGLPARRDSTPALPACLGIAPTGIPPVDLLYAIDAFLGGAVPVLSPGAPASGVVIAAFAATVDDGSFAPEFGDRPVDAALVSEEDDTFSSTPRRITRPPAFACAVLDGHETEEELDDLALDVLLFEGRSPRNVAVLWAPEGMSPDPLLDACAELRARVPASSGLAGGLAMTRAFAKKSGLPHAYLEDGTLLLSRGDPEPQRPAHVRWCDYRSVDEAVAWADSAAGLELVVRSERLPQPFRVPAVRPGEAHAWVPAPRQTVGPAAQDA